MRIGKFTFRLNTIAARFYWLLGKIWFVPFGFYSRAILDSGNIPHPLVPRSLRDLILHKMMFPDNSERAIVADKIALRGWAAERMGAQHLIPLYDKGLGKKHIADKRAAYHAMATASLKR